MSVAMPIQTDWLRTVLFDRGYLARIKGDAIKVYLVMVAACGGQPDRSVSLSLRQLMDQTELSCPTIIACLTRLEELGLIVPSAQSRGRMKTYYLPDPPESFLS